ncbi:HAMP domain-containing protein [Paenibacillus sp. LMG 31460]|uniref:histidine kinase n=1 Tax=Paenibacillus germinis TaxID=2654979 RepID=A0ABX1YYW4_9BACL|nr:histidine kinase [Paenibacillus germinis]NOU85344.1 HAMP domain-containing protein [Paenibacillus germinis]
MRKLADVLSGFYYNLNLRTKLVFSYLILIIVPVFLLVYFTYTTIHKSVVEQTGNAYLEALKQAEKNVAFGLDVGYVIADLAQSNYDIQKVLQTVAERQLTSAEVIDFFNVLNKNVTNYEGKRNVLKVSFFMKGNPAFLSANPNFFSVGELEKDSALKPLLNESKKQAWFHADVIQHLQLAQADEVLFIKEIHDINHFQQILGYVMIEFDSKFIWDILNDLRLPDGAETLVHTGGVRIGVKHLPLGDVKLEQQFLSSLPIRQEGITHFGPGIGTYYAVNSKLSGLDWNISLLMTERHLGMNSRSIQNFMFALAAFVSILAIITAFFISGSITKRLKKLIRLIRLADGGQFETETNIRGNDEYSRLQRSFNQMSMTTKALIEEVYQVKISKQETEMKLLYAQINPHFLYNTLDIIQWSALRIDAKEIAEITESLAKFLRLSLNEGKEHIRLSEEVEEVNRYMHIINYRYRGAIRFETDIEEGIADVVIIKMILQPLVENAVIHGIRPKPGKAGTITVRASQQGEFVYLEVSDDGIGMTEEQLKGVLEIETRGYGVKSVNQRIQVHYGEECGLQFFSQPGSGCRAVAKLKPQLLAIPPSQSPSYS